MWRYSRIGDLDLERYAPAAAGLDVTVDLSDSWTAAGATVARATDLDDPDVMDAAWR